MTRRSAILAVLGAAALSAVLFYNNHLLRNTNLVGSFLPVGVFAGTILFARLANPLLRRLGPDAPWTAGELAGVAAVLMFACGILSAGVLQHASTLAMMPWHWDRTRPEWSGDPAAPEPRAVRDWPALVRALDAGAADKDAGARRAFARRVPDAARRGAGDPEARDGLEARERLRSALSAAIADPALPGDIAPGLRPALPRYAERWLRIPPSQRTPAQVAGLNRALFDAAFPDAVIPRRPPALDLAPPRMLADPGIDAGAALDGFVTGMRQGSEPFPPGRVPWSAWTRTFRFWGPLIFAASVLLVGLSLVLHRQWMTHEHLPYPTVEFLRTMLPEEGQPYGAVFRRRTFWVGFGFVFAIHAVNYAYLWWPDYVIPVSRNIDFQPLLELVPLWRYGDVNALFRPTIYFTAVGFAFLLASDVSLSLGLSPYLYTLVAGGAATYGVAFGGGFLELNVESQLRAGGYAAMFLAILYSGRHYYGAVLRRGIGRPARDAVEPGAVWGARIAGLAFAAFVGQMIAVGVGSGMAVAYAVAGVATFVVLSRLVAEAGVFYMNPSFYPCALLVSFLGTTAAGYEQMVVLGLVTAMLWSDPKESLMPFVVTGLRLADRSGARVTSVARWGVVAVLLALLIGTPVTLYFQYRDGATQTNHPWATGNIPRATFDRAAAMTRSLQSQGALGQANAARGMDRLRQATPRPGLVLAFGITFTLVLLFTFLRHRFARWPFHPLIFLVLGSYQGRLMAFSVLLGWAVKGLAMKFGGARAYQRLKPLMIGLIAGEVIAAALPLAVGAVYAAVTGRPPPAHSILPG